MTTNRVDLRAVRHQEIEAAAAELLAKGKTPREVRMLFSQYGVRWEYQFRGQGRTERMRRLEKLGRTLCRCGLDSIPVSFDPVDGPLLCSACLEKKWAAV